MYYQGLSAISRYFRTILQMALERIGNLDYFIWIVDRGSMFLSPGCRMGSWLLDAGFLDLGSWVTSHPQVSTFRGAHGLFLVYCKLLWIIGTLVKIIIAFFGLL